MDNEIVRRIESIEKELSGIKEELYKQNKEKESVVVHLKDKAKFMRYSNEVSNRSILELIKTYNLVIGDRINIQWSYYYDPTFIIVNIDSEGRYYLMPINNLDALPMHHDYNLKYFEDTDMYTSILPWFKCGFGVYENTNYKMTITLASKEEIFDKDKAFPYFKTLFKEGRGKYIREFGNESSFWLRSAASTGFFALASNCGNLDYGDVSYSNGFRPLIILGE